MSRVSRRAFLARAAAALGVTPVLLAACQSPAAPAANTPAASAPSASTPASAATKPAAGTAAAAAPAATQAPAAAGGEIRFSALLNITGPTAAQGELFTRAVRVGEKQVNAAGGINGKKLTVIIQDNQSTNPGCLAALNRAIEQDKPLCIIGPVLSTQVQAISDTDKQAAIPMATGGTAVKNTHMGNPWLFRMRPDDSVAGSAMVKYIKEGFKLTKVGVLHDSDAFGTGGADVVEQGCKDLGLTLVKRQPYTAGTKDYTSQILALKTAGAEVMIVYATRPEDVALIERQYRDLGSPFQYLGSPSSAESDTLALSKEAATGLYAVVDFVLGESAPSKAYIDAYTKEYNTAPDALSSWNYDAVILFADAIKQVGEDRTKIMQNILARHGWEGVCGSYDFTPNGDGLHQVSVVQIQQGGKIKFIQVVKVAAPAS